VTHAREPTVAGNAARSPQAIVNGIITPITQFIEYPSWLYRQIHLKSDMVGQFISFFGRVMYASTKRDDGDEIDKGFPALSIIDNGCLAFLGGRKQFTHVGNGLWGHEATWFTSCDVAGRRLQEAAITSKNFLLAIARQLAERGRSVDNRAVVASHVHNDERA
jgi:hypothetical protein